MVLIGLTLLSCFFVFFPSITTGQHRFSPLARLSQFILSRESTRTQPYLGRQTNPTSNSFALPVNSRRPGFGGNGPFVWDLAFLKRTAVAAERAEWVTWCPAEASLSLSPSWPALSVNCDLLIWMLDVKATTEASTEASRNTAVTLQRKWPIRGGFGFLEENGGGGKMGIMSTLVVRRWPVSHSLSLGLRFRLTATF